MWECGSILGTVARFDDLDATESREAHSELAMARGVSAGSGLVAAWPGRLGAAVSRCANGGGDDKRTSSCFWRLQKHLAAASAAELPISGARRGCCSTAVTRVLAIGEGSQAIAPGILYGGWRPVATYFGVRARPVRKKSE